MTPRLSDPAGSPRFPFRREATREHPIWQREQFGPWQCDVRVTPITGIRAASPVFEVFCHWERGPALDESHGPAPPTGMRGNDIYVIDPAARDMMLRRGQASELAINLAKWAADLLADGIKPDLPPMARALRKRLK